MPLGFVLLCARVLLQSKVHIIPVLLFRFYFYFYVHCPSKNDEFSYYAKQVGVISSSSLQPQILFHNY